MRLPHRYRVYDVLHKTTVYLLMSGAALGYVLLGVQGYYYVKMYDVLHKTAVTLLMTGAALGYVLLGLQGYYYVKNVRPEKIEKSRIYLEEELAKEQLAKEQELLLKQKDNETLKN